MSYIGWQKRVKVRYPHIIKADEPYYGNLDKLTFIDLYIFYNYVKKDPNKNGIIVVSSEGYYLRNLRKPRTLVRGDS